MPKAPAAKRLAPKPQPAPRVTVTVHRPLLQRVDAFAASLGIDVPGARGIALRKLLIMGLATVEKQ